MSIRKLISVFLVMAFVIGCTSQTVPALKIVSSPWPGFEPIYLGRDLDFFDRTKFKITEMPSLSVAWESFANGSADVATVTLDEALRLAAGEHKLKILLVMDTSFGGDAVVTMPNIKTISNLRGRRIATTNIPLGIHMLNRFLEVGGLKISDVEVIYVSEDRHEKLYSEGKVDAFITFDPFKSRLEKKGAKVLFDSRRIPEEIFDILVVSQEVYEKRRDDLCELSENWYKALQYVEDNKSTAAEKMGKRLGVTGKEFLAMADGVKFSNRENNRRLLAGENPQILVPVQRLKSIMLKEKLINRDFDFDQLIDKSFQDCNVK